ncbi:cupredoxin domain-containing protein [Actinoplanes sp. HUAS TT8]|uniref:cupredoxin domain-containing protein n=1 Tax=Actinoplanes sp. HUAS TT8 TaxID=3447453 RepID=UPI003F521466
MRKVRHVAWALSMVALAGCAPAAAPAGSAAGQPQPQTTTRPAASRKADCTKATKVLIVDSGSELAFSPAKLTIQRDAFLAVVNRSKAAHPLRSEPDAGMVTSVIGLQERQVIQFPDEGTFAVRTGGAELRLTVAGDSGCGAPKPELTITKAGVFTPSTVKVVATENFAVVNESGATQSVTCTPGSNSDHTRLEAGETQILALDEPGRYVCASRQHPSAKVTVVVTGD